jgi:hypothetical protein
MRFKMCDSLKLTKSVKLSWYSEARHVEGEKWGNGKCKRLEMFSLSHHVLVLTFFVPHTNSKVLYILYKQKNTDYITL